jgi:ubiquinone/menaquinone biosynthesis C-methylase UbiE
MNLPEPKELAAHLRKPSGETGKRVGEFMHKGNANFYQQLPALIQWKIDAKVLEIGMGSGLHVQQLKTNFPNGEYLGLDYSETMVEQSKMNNPNTVFYCADAADLPFENNFLDVVLSINTVYFLPEPLKVFKAIYNSLKVGGVFCLGKRTLEDLNTLQHITQHGFRKISADEVSLLMQQAGFKNITVQVFQDPPIKNLEKPFQLHSEFVIGIK